MFKVIDFKLTSITAYMMKCKKHLPHCLPT